MWLSCSAGCKRDASADEKTLPRQRPEDTAITAQMQRDAGSPPLVVFLGDSISAGLQLPAEQAFPAVLASLLGAHGTPIRVANAGVSGDTSAGGLRRVDWVMKQKPALVVVELGANDGLRGLPVATLEHNLRAIILRIRALGARPLLLGMVLPPSYGSVYAHDFSEVYERLARELDVPFVPYFMEGVAGVPELNFPDGIHPTAVGHRRLATKLLPTFAALLAPSAR